MVNTNNLRGFNYAQTARDWYTPSYTAHEWHFDLAKNCGATQCRLMLSPKMWMSNPTLTNGMLYQDHMVQARNWLKNRGIHVTLFLAPDPEDRGAEARWRIVSDPTLSQAWIDTLVSAMQKLNPDDIEIFSELQSGSDFYGPIPEPHFTVVFPTWWNFMDRAIKAIRAVNPAIPIIVESCPFWDMSQIAAKPFPYDSLIYAFHLYCVADVDVGCLGIMARLWSEGRDEEAKQIYRDFILKSSVPNSPCIGIGVQKILDLGLPVFCMECGSTSGHWHDWTPRNMHYHYDLMQELGIGWSQHALANDFHGESYGMLTYDGTELNEIGLLWCQNTLTPTLPVDLPVIAAGGLAVVDAALVAYYLAKYFKII